MSEITREMPRKYHEAVVHWQQHNFPDYSTLLETWDTYFPKDRPFCLCARLADDPQSTIQVGEHAGDPKAIAPAALPEETARELLGGIRVQASTEFGSIRQHRGTLDRARDDQDRAWVMRVMAEELRHGYQMVHLLTSADWSPATDDKTDDMVETLLETTTGQYHLAAFNIDFDSFLDNIVFAAFIDRVGKYQLTMQKSSAYTPYAQSMPPMLREEAFHLAAGVVPLRRWVERAAKGDPAITVEQIQKVVNKWYPRGLEMFGFEKEPYSSQGVRLGLKDMTNAQAQAAYTEECRQMLADLSRRSVRARLPQKSAEEIDAIVARIEAGDTVEGLTRDDGLRLPDKRFYRRNFEGAYEMVGTGGRTFDDVEAYVRHLVASLPEAYLSTRDFSTYAANLRGVAAGTMTLKQAIKNTPRLARMGGTCPCASSVRWVAEVE